MTREAPVTTAAPPVWGTSNISAAPGLDFSRSGSLHGAETSHSTSNNSSTAPGAEERRDSGGSLGGSQGSTPQWESITPRLAALSAPELTAALSSERLWSSAVTVGSAVYLFGGVSATGGVANGLLTAATGVTPGFTSTHSSGAGTLHADLLRFDTELEKLEVVEPADASAPRPVARHSHTMVATPDGTRLILFGGATEGPTPLNDLWIFSLPALRWSKVRREGSAAAVSDKHGAVAVGVTVAPPSATTLRQPIRGSRAHRPVSNGLRGSPAIASHPEGGKAGGLASWPAPRYLHSAVLDGKDGMLVFGGWVQDWAKSAPVWRLHLDTLTWSLLDDGMGGGATAPVTPVGSSTSPASPSGPSTSGTADPSAPRSRLGHAAAFWGGNMYIFGGSRAGRPLSELWAFNTVTGKWRPIAAPELPLATHGAPAPGVSASSCATVKSPWSSYPLPRRWHSGVVLHGTNWLMIGGVVGGDGQPVAAPPQQHVQSALNQSAVSQQVSQQSGAPLGPENAQNEVLLSECACFNFAKEEWSEFSYQPASYPLTLQCHCTAVVESDISSSIYVFFGRSKSRGTATSAPLNPGCSLPPFIAKLDFFRLDAHYQIAQDNSNIRTLMDDLEGRRSAILELTPDRLAKILLSSKQLYCENGMAVVERTYKRIMEKISAHSPEVAASDLAVPEAPQTARQATSGSTGETLWPMLKTLITEFQSLDSMLSQLLESNEGVESGAAGASSENGPSTREEGASAETTVCFTHQPDAQPEPDGAAKLQHLSSTSTLLSGLATFLGLESPDTVQKLIISGGSPQPGLDPAKVAMQLSSIKAALQILVSARANSSNLFLTPAAKELQCPGDLPAAQACIAFSREAAAPAGVYCEASKALRCDANSSSGVPRQQIGRFESQKLEASLQILTLLIEKAKNLAAAFRDTPFKSAGVSESQLRDFFATVREQTISEMACNKKASMRQAKVLSFLERAAAEKQAMYATRAAALEEQRQQSAQRRARILDEVRIFIETKMGEYASNLEEDRAALLELEAARMELVGTTRRIAHLVDGLEVPRMEKTALKHSLGKVIVPVLGSMETQTLMLFQNLLAAAKEQSVAAAQEFARDKQRFTALLADTKELLERQQLYRTTARKLLVGRVSAKRGFLSVVKSVGDQLQDQGARGPAYDEEPDDEEAVEQQISMLQKNVEETDREIQETNATLEALQTMKGDFMGVMSEVESALETFKTPASDLSKDQAPVVDSDSEPANQRCDENSKESEISRPAIENDFPKECNLYYLGKSAFDLKAVQESEEHSIDNESIRESYLLSWMSSLSTIIDLSGLVPTSAPHSSPVSQRGPPYAAGPTKGAIAGKQGRGIGTGDTSGATTTSFLAAGGAAPHRTSMARSYTTARASHDGLSNRATFTTPDKLRSRRGPLNTPPTLDTLSGASNAGRILGPADDPKGQRRQISFDQQRKVAGPRFGDKIVVAAAAAGATGNFLVSPTTKAVPVAAPKRRIPTDR